MPAQLQFLLLVFFVGFPSSSLFFDLVDLLPCLTLGPGAFFCFLFSMSSDFLSEGILQNSFPKHLIVFDDSVGGSVSQ
jgi:hypothetical protein